MRIDLFTIMRNEEDLLPYFLRHYETFVDNIFIFDDRSTDKTAEIAKKNPKVKLLKFNYLGDCDELEKCFEYAYKKYSRGKADWVFCIDGDEFIYNENILNVLQQQKDKGSVLLKATGFNMYSETFPTTDKQIYEECNKGIRGRLYDKAVVFNPNINMRFNGGRHNPPKGIKFLRCKLKLLHYRYLSKEFILKRWGCSKRNFSDEKYKFKINKDLKKLEMNKDISIKII